MAQRQMWEIEIRHEGLNKYRHIRGSDRYVVHQKAAAQEMAWEEIWQKKQELNNKKLQREKLIKTKEQKKEFALAKTKEAQMAISQLENLLLQTLSINDAISWESLIDKNPFSEPKPKEFKDVKIPPAPSQSDANYQPKFNFLDKLFKKNKQKKIAGCDDKFRADFSKWTYEKEKLIKLNINGNAAYKESYNKWLDRKSSYENLQQENNLRILEQKKSYFNCEDGAILDYCEMVLSNSSYPDYFPQEWELGYFPETKILLLDYSLPSIESLPKIKEVKYVASRDDFSESTISLASLNQLYDNVLYQIALRTIHEIFEADVVNSIYSIVFNGWVESTDKAKGVIANTCVMSVQVTKEQFLKLNLGKVDPKACFKLLKGIGSSKLHGLTAIAPILNIDKNDRRFVSSYDVINSLGEVDNLAIMDWLDFENLIREIFEKEFHSSGGEVKITQASRDGGVDAVAFDPDPIRGGKIVIQAKRYTNTVGVSAVRDLWGTTMNEGATKGILVTTSDYGPDAYEFAKGKPLTLLSGSNFLSLLQKHGHSARIDLREAKKLLGV